MIKFKGLELLYYIEEETYIDFYCRDKGGIIKIWREYKTK